MNIFEFYNNLSGKRYSGINVILYKDNIDRKKFEEILKVRYLKGCSLEFNYFVFDLEEKFEISSISSSLQAYSFGCDRNVIVIYSFESLNAKDRDLLISSLEKSDNADIFIFSREKYKSLSKFNIIEIKAISKRPSDIVVLVNEMCKKHGIRLSPKNMKLIVQLYGNDIDKIDRVLEQLELIGDQIKDKPDLFLKVVGEGSQISFYKLSKSFLDKDDNGMKENIDNLLNWGVHPVLFLSMFKSMLLKIVAVYEGESLRGDYLKEKYEKIARELDDKKVKKLFDLFYNMEYKLRVIGIDRDVIDFYTHELLKAI